MKSMWVGLAAFGTCILCLVISVALGALVVLVTGDPSRYDAALKLGLTATIIGAGAGAGWLHWMIYATKVSGPDVDWREVDVFIRDVHAGWPGFANWWDELPAAHYGKQDVGTIPPEPFEEALKRFLAARGK